MRLIVIDNTGKPADVSVRVMRLQDLGFDVAEREACSPDEACVQLVPAHSPTFDPHSVALSDSIDADVESVLRVLPIDFEALEIIAEGDSKQVRSLTDVLVLERLKPTVYSYTMNRYGYVEGTGELRTRFSAEVFRRMAGQLGPEGVPLRTAYVGLVETAQGPVLAQRRVTPCNLEVRVKRYHIGSPIHRYHFTEDHPTAHRGKPLERWSRFDAPVVCFDWRHPLVGTDGVRLADEPISDDYAAIWMDDAPSGKSLARNAFLWLEGLFANASLVLVDICFFVDATGHTIYGEISPDCMRVRDAASDSAPALDKDQWRSGSSGEEVRNRYNELHERLFANELEVAQ